MKFITGLCPGIIYALMLIASSSGAVEFSGQAYIRYSDWGHITAGPSSEFHIRRASITAETRILHNLSVELEVETRPDEAYLKDCIVAWSPWSSLEISLGRFKKPFCIGTTTSNRRLLSVERPLTHDLVSDLGYSGRSVGVMTVFRPPLPFAPGISAGVFNGPGNDREKMYVLRAEFEPLGDLTLGGSYSVLRLGEPNPMLPSGYIVSDRMGALSAHLRYRPDITDDIGVSIDGEYIRGDNWDSADVVYGESPPAFETRWLAATVELRLRDVPGIRSLEGGLAWSERKPEVHAESRSSALAPMLGVAVSRNSRVRLTAISRSLHGVTTQEYTDYIAELMVRF